MITAKFVIGLFLVLWPIVLWILATGDHKDEVSYGEFLLGSLFITAMPMAFFIGLRLLYCVFHQPL